MNRLVTMLPESFIPPLNKLFMARMTFMMTNVKGPEKPCILGGAKSDHIKCLIPNFPDIAGGFCIVSHNDKVKLSFQTDIGKCRDGKLIIRLLEKNLDLFLQEV